MLTFGKTGFGTSGSNVSINYYGVTKRRNVVKVSLEGLMTFLTFVGGITPFGTGGKCYYAFVAVAVSFERGI